MTEQNQPGRQERPVENKPLGGNSVPQEKQSTHHPRTKDELFEHAVIPLDFLDKLNPAGLSPDYFNNALIAPKFALETNNLQYVSEVFGTMLTYTEYWGGHIDRQNEIAGTEQGQAAGVPPITEPEQQEIMDLLVHNHPEGKELDKVMKEIKGLKDKSEAEITDRLPQLYTQALAIVDPESSRDASEKHRGGPGTPHKDDLNGPDYDDVREQFRDNDEEIYIPEAVLELFDRNGVMKGYADQFKLDRKMQGQNMIDEVFKIKRYYEYVESKVADVLVNQFDPEDLDDAVDDVLSVVLDTDTAKQLQAGQDVKKIMDMRMSPTALTEENTNIMDVMRLFSNAYKHADALRADEATTVEAPSQTVDRPNPAQMQSMIGILEQISKIPPQQRTEEQTSFYADYWLKTAEYRQETGQAADLAKPASVEVVFNRRGSTEEEIETTDPDKIALLDRNQKIKETEEVIPVDAELQKENPNAAEIKRYGEAMWYVDAFSPEDAPKHFPNLPKEAWDVADQIDYEVLPADPETRERIVIQEPTVSEGVHLGGDDEPAAEKDDKNRAPGSDLGPGQGELNFRAPHPTERDIYRDDKFGGR